MTQRYLISALTLLIGSFCANASALAASSEWFVTQGAKIRLVGLPSTDGKTIDSGLQIVLEKGWKTYWKSPGASGLPPQLSFAGSKNVAGTKLHFPVPKTFGDGDNLTAGYTRSVTLPITVEPLFANRPTDISAQGLVGICGEICVPVQFALSMKIGTTSVSKRDEASALFLGKTALPQAAHDGFEITAAQTSDGKTVIVDAQVPAGTKQAELFVDAPQGWYLTPASLDDVSGETVRFELVLADKPDHATLAQTPLQMTLVADGAGVEQMVTISDQ